MRHIEPENWNVIKNAKEGMTCKQFIKANDALEQYKKEFINIQVLMMIIFMKEYGKQCIRLLLY